MLKVLGAVLILMATSKIGFDSARQLRKRPRQIQELRSGLAILKTEINYGTRPLAEAFERIAEASGELKAGLPRSEPEFKYLRMANPPMNV
jgi:stage III sporulation protein AB